MANGSGAVLEQLQRILDGEDTIPTNVTTRLLLSGIMEIYHQTKDIKDSQDHIIQRLSSLEARPVVDCAANHAALLQQIEKGEKEEHSKLISFKYIWEHYGEKILWLIIAGGVGAALAKVFGA